MNSHALARLLLTLPDLPIATEAMNHVYCSVADARSHGSFKIGRLHHYAGEHLLMGGISKRNINGQNWHITEMLHGDAPQEWNGHGSTWHRCDSFCDKVADPYYARLAQDEVLGLSR